MTATSMRSGDFLLPNARTTTDAERRTTPASGADGPPASDRSVQVTVGRRDAAATCRRLIPDRPLDDVGVIDADGESEALGAHVLPRTPADDMKTSAAGTSPRRWLAPGRRISTLDTQACDQVRFDRAETFRFQAWRRAVARFGRVPHAAPRRRRQGAAPGSFPGADHLRPRGSVKPRLSKGALVGEARRTAPCAPRDVSRRISFERHAAVARRERGTVHVPLAITVALASDSRARHERGRAGAVDRSGFDEHAVRALVQTRRGLARRPYRIDPRAPEPCAGSDPRHPPSPVHAGDLPSRSHRPRS